MAEWWEGFVEVTGHIRRSSVRRMQEALRGGPMGETDRVRIAEDLHARVWHLRSLDAKVGAVTVSRCVEESSPSVMTA